MGFSVCWIAVRGKSPDAVLNELNFTRTGERSELIETGYYLAALPNGWFVVIDDHQDFHFYNDKTFQQITQSCEIVTCAVEEHTMYSAASHWKDGQKLWSVDHDSSKGVENLMISGDLPLAYASIRDRQLAHQRSDRTANQGIGVDYVFEVPIQLADELTGYRHDKDLEDAGDRPFEVLKQTVLPKKTFIQRLFGGR
jgi:hypothetical protein